MIFDTHAHLYDEKYDNPDEVIKECYAKGVTLIMIPSDTIENSKKALALANAYPFVYCAVGIHPEEVDGTDIKNSRETIKKLAANPKVKAIGEIGLDKHWKSDEETLACQKEFFIMQIDLANELHLPVIVHDRDAHQDTLDILKEHKALYGGVLHCFSGSKEMMKEFVKLGFYIGVDGPVTYKNSLTPKEVASLIPEDRIVIETDSPYLPPVPFRGKTNYPYYLEYVLNQISELRNISREEAERITYENGKRLFGI